MVTRTFVLLPVEVQQAVEVLIVPLNGVCGPGAFHASCKCVVALQDTMFVLSAR